MAITARFNQDSLHPHSLGVRVMLSAFIVLSIFSLIIVAVLDHNHKIKIIEKYNKQLELQLYNLIAISEFENNELQISSFFNDQRLNQKNGDLIAIIFNDDDTRIWDSFSAKTTRFDSPPDSQIATPVSNLMYDSFNNRKFLTQTLRVIWDNKENIQQLTFMVALDSDAYATEISDYREQLLLGSAIAIGSILFLQGIILFFGFQSLNKITIDLSAIIQGKKITLDGRYPRELQSVSKAINHLIESERAQKERYQKSLADLAHSLKTPLSVLQAYTEKLENKTIFSEQIERIDQIISYQLQRASHSGNTLISNPVDVKHIVKEINKALEKVYQQKRVTLVLQADEQSFFFGDKNDLMELLGNLMDNAYKHCTERILIRIKQSTTRKNRTLEICVEDDGQGVAEEDREFILQRGARADSLNPGQGIGLAVVVDIVSAYHGSIQIKESQLGGAAFQVNFEQTLI